MVEPQNSLQSLPLKRELSLVYIGSLSVAALTAAASLAGVFFATILYPSEALQQSSIPNDLVTLIIGLPMLLGSLWAAKRGKWLGLLLWPGALLYGFYNYLVYLLGMPLSWFTLLYLAIVLLSVYLTFDLYRSIDHAAVYMRLSGRVPIKFPGWVMLIFGVFFIARVIGVIAAALAEKTSLPMTEIGLAIADTTLSLLWIVGGILLLRRNPWGYVSALGLLFAASMLFVGLLAFFLLQPWVAGVPFPVEDFVVVAVMGLICFVPFGLFLHGVRGTR